MDPCKCDHLQGMGLRAGLPATVLLALVAGCGGRTISGEVPGRGASASASNGAPDEGATTTGPQTTAAGAPSARTGASSGAAVEGSPAPSGESPASPAPHGCAVGGDGLTNCGATGESCCTTLTIQGGTFFRAYSPGGADAGTTDGASGEAHPATVSSFRLDKYDVTVGRFRQFVNAWHGDQAYLPPPGSGKHTHLHGGLGVEDSASPGTFEPGWLASDDANIRLTDPSYGLDCGPATWTDSPAEDETLPINCVNWWEAYAFCIFDGGFLPTETEWEYAAAGGSEQREYPWGWTSPGMSNAYAIYDNYFSGGAGLAGPFGPGTGSGRLAPVGTPILGAGKWGQLDLVGNVSQWTLDGYADYIDPCVDCANLTALSDRTSVGGYFQAPLPEIAVPYRGDAVPPSANGLGEGIRCARVP